MTIILVDDEPIIAKGEAQLIRSCAPEAEVHVFSSSEEAIAFAENHPVDVAFLDIELADINGIQLARTLKRKQRNLNIIFCTAYDSHYRDAMELHASGYLLKPLSAEAVRAELADLRYRGRTPGKGMFVRTFGSFEVFYDDEPLLFHYSKTKELFAYLIDRRGAVISRDELVTVLWGGEEEHASYFKQIQKDLKDTLASVGMEWILIKQRGSLGVLMKGFRCDYFDWLNSLPEGINAYHGEYMRQYDWGESTWVNLEGKTSLWIP